MKCEAYAAHSVHGPCLQPAVPPRRNTKGTNSISRDRISRGMNVTARLKRCPPSPLLKIRDHPCRQGGLDSFTGCSPERSERPALLQPLRVKLLVDNSVRNHF